MAHRWTNDLTRAEVTPKAHYLNRRDIMRGVAGIGIATAGFATGLAGRAAAQAGALEPNTFEEITTYNNFYEFGTGKEDPLRNAGAMQIAPWSIRVDGLVDNPGDYALEDLLDGLTEEERIYGSAVSRRGRWWCRGADTSWPTFWPRSA